MSNFGIFKGFSDKLFEGELPTSLGTIGSITFGFDADAQAFFDRVTTAGGTLSATEKTAVNQLVIDLKGYSIWSKMKAIYPMVGASAAACAQNLKSSSFTGTFNGGITYASTGVTSNGTSGYMTTGIVPNTDLLLNSSHLSYYSRTNNMTGQQGEMGALDGTTGICSLMYYGSGLADISRANNGFPGTSGGVLTDTRGFFIVNRIVSTAFTTRMNNTILSNFTVSSNSLTSQSFVILAINNSTVGGVGAYSLRQCAFSSIGDGLTTTEQTNFYTAVQAFQTTLSRQV